MSLGVFPLMLGLSPAALSSLPDPSLLPLLELLLQVPRCLDFRLKPQLWQ